MMETAIENILAQLHNRFEVIYGDRLSNMLLYGSQARGDADPESDIDVLVVLKGYVSPCDEIDRTIKDIADVSLENDVVTSCVFVSEDQFENEHSPLLMNVRREGIVYEPSIKVDLEQKRIAKVKELKGICSHLPGGSEEFMREKHIH